VSECLAADAQIDASEVSVEVQNGTVKLTGGVPERAMKHRMENLIESRYSVKEIENYIRVSSSSNATGSSAGSAGMTGGQSTLTCSSANRDKGK